MQFLQGAGLIFCFHLLEKKMNQVCIFVPFNASRVSAPSSIVFPSIVD